MDKKIAAIITIIAALVGGGSLFTYSSVVTTTITGDTITEITTNLNIPLEEIKEICLTEDIPKKYQAACDLIEGLP